MDRIKEKCVFLLMFLLIPSTAIATISVCPNKDGNISSFSLFGNPKSGCHNFMHGVESNFDTVKGLLKTVPDRYLLISGKNVIEIDQTQKNAVDQKIADDQAQAKADAKIARELAFDNSLDDTRVEEAVLPKFDTMIDNISSFADLKDFLKKQARFILKQK